MEVEKSFLPLHSQPKGKEKSRAADVAEDWKQKDWNERKQGRDDQDSCPTEASRYIETSREAIVDKFLKEMSMMRSGVMKYEFKYRVPYYILKSMSNRQIKKKTIFNDS